MRYYGDLPVPISLDELLQPAKAALVVYDMQVGICRQVPEAPEITAKVAELVEAARKAGVRIVYTRHLSLPKAWMGAAQFRMGMAWQRVDDPGAVNPWFLRDTAGFEIVPDLAPTPDDAVFDKIAMSAFEGTPLTTALRDCGITSVIFAGIATEIGIEPSCRHAADLGFIPILARDACGHGHADAAQRSIEALEFAGDTVITDVPTICSTLDGAEPRRL